MLCAAAAATMCHKKDSLLILVIEVICFLAFSRCVCPLLRYLQCHSVLRRHR